MDQRGRKSFAKLADSAIPQVGEWPKPPDELTKAQGANWDRIVHTKPSDWFGPDTFPLLIAYVRLKDTSDKIASVLNEFDPSWILKDPDLKRFQLLTRLQGANAKTLAMLATKMRLAQQSRYETKVAGTASRLAGKGSKPWEVAKGDSPEGGEILNGLRSTAESPRASLLGNLSNLGHSSERSS